ncbi:MAG: sporulation protein [Firmicutes bacterium]|mgnify:CR=1 FL=1|jgi:sporulation protein YqfC|nr:sporulation protein [Bacillota bacterium]
MPRKLNLKKQFAQLMDLPPEAVINSALIKIVGNLEISISNHRGLVEYTTTAIRVASPQGVIAVSGAGLVIHYLSSDEIKVGGRITGVELQ